MQNPSAARQAALLAFLLLCFWLGATALSYLLALLAASKTHGGALFAWHVQAAFQKVPCEADFGLTMRQHAAF